MESCKNNHSHVHCSIGMKTNDERKILVIKILNQINQINHTCNNAFVCVSLEIKVTKMAEKIVHLLSFLLTFITMNDS